MEPLIGLLGLVGAGVYSFFKSFKTNYHYEIMLAAGRLRNLKIHGDKKFPKLSGKIKGFTVDVITDGAFVGDSMDAVRYPDSLDFTINFHRSISPITITRKATGNKLRKLVGMKHKQTGNRYFDNLIHLNTLKQADILNLLNEETRAALEKLSKKTSGFHLSDKLIRLSWRLGQINTERDIIYYIDSLVSLSTRICREIKDKKGLIDIITSNQNPDVRLRILEELITLYSVDSEVKEVLQNCMQVGTYREQLFAAPCLGIEGMEHLTTIIKDPRKVDETIMCKIIGILKENEYTKSMGPMKELYEKQESIKVKLAILDAFKTICHSSLNPFLLDQLKKGGSKIRFDVIELLGIWGTVDNIEELYPYTKSFTNVRVNTAAKRAIAHIQSRLDKGDKEDKGKLSFVETSEMDGALSVSDKAGDGALSMDKSSQK
ncbi:MAG: hypothetical protein GY754_21730 [bacterium]|nr:hypothetical protein [bacterium]